MRFHIHPKIALNNSQGIHLERRNVYYKLYTNSNKSNMNRNGEAKITRDLSIRIWQMDKINVAAERTSINIYSSTSIDLDSP